MSETKEKKMRKRIFISPKTLEREAREKIPPELRVRRHKTKYYVVDEKSGEQVEYCSMKRIADKYDISESQAFRILKNNSNRICVLGIKILSIPVDEIKTCTNCM